jgi:hypothetical protein
MGMIPTESSGTYPTPITTAGFLHPGQQYCGIAIPITQGIEKVWRVRGWLKSMH